MKSVRPNHTASAIVVLLDLTVEFLIAEVKLCDEVAQLTGLSLTLEDPGNNKHAL